MFIYLYIYIFIYLYIYLGKKVLKWDLEKIFYGVELLLQTNVKVVTMKVEEV